MRVASGALTSRAPAKINLTLHVVARRADGFHDLESFVAFSGTGDALTLTPGAPLALEVAGRTAALVGPTSDNLVLKAARLLQERVEGLKVGAFQLTKRLPVAAGIGGGSSDAAAALRLLARLNGLGATDRRLVEAAALTGSDVPVCIEPRARMMRGRGENLGPPLELPPLFAVLVNPGVPVETPAVFKRLGLPPGQAVAAPKHPEVPDRPSATSLLGLLRRARNDLEPLAAELQPLIRETLAVLQATPGCRLARMSGSGATCFGLYDNCHDAAAAARSLMARQPVWWVKSTVLR